MKYETGTFELRDNDMMMRELTSAETNEVAGGTGFASVSAASQSGVNSAITLSGSFTTSATNVAALASISANISAVGPNNAASMSAFAEVF